MSSVKIIKSDMEINMQDYAISVASWAFTFYKDHMEIAKYIKE